MLNCKEVSQLVCDSIDKKLPFWTRMNLIMHLSMCGLCKRFRKTILRVHAEAIAYADEVEKGNAHQDITLSNEAKLAILDRLENDRA